MQLHDTLNDGQAETRAAGLVAVASPEALENKLAFIRGHARSLVETAHRAVFRNHKLYRRSRSSVVDHVLREVSAGSAQHLRLGLDHYRIVVVQHGNVL